MNDYEDYLDEDQDDEDQDDGAQEWQPGNCDRCLMQPGESGPLGMCCACSIGQGASQADCQCPWGN